MSTRFTQSQIDAYNARQGVLRPQPANASEDLERIIQGEIAAHLDSIQAYYVWHRTDRPSTCAVGVPDFVGCVRGVPFGLEVKRKGGKATVEQHGELLRIRMAGGKTAVVWSGPEAVEFIRNL